MEDSIRKVRANIARCGERFPKVSRDGIDLLNGNEDWACGFWPGMLRGLRGYRYE